MERGQLIGCQISKARFTDWVDCLRQPTIILLITCVICTTSGVALSQEPSLCGQPPRVDDEMIKGTIEGKAKFLAAWIGDAGLSGQIQASRVDVFKQAPDGMKSRADAYLQYQVCIFLMADKKLSTKEKIDELVRVRQSFLTPVVE